MASLISFIRSNPGLKRPFPGAYRYCRGLPDFFHYRFGTFYHLVGWSAVRIIILSASIIPQLLLSFFFSIIFFLQLRGEWCFLQDKEERRLNSVLFSVRKKKKIGMIKKEALRRWVILWSMLCKILKMIHFIYLKYLFLQDIFLLCFSFKH